MHASAGKWSHRVLVASAACAGAALLRLSGADGPGMMNYQATVKSNGQWLTSNGMAVVFSIYAAPSGATALYRERDVVDVVDGLYSTHIGDNPEPGLACTNLTDALALAGSNSWLGVSLAGGAELVPRERLLAVPYVLAGAAAASTQSVVQCLSVSNLVAGTARFDRGIVHVEPMGDLSMGIYTNGP